jgi:hypothetical protein
VRIDIIKIIQNFNEIVLIKSYLHHFKKKAHKRMLRFLTLFGIFILLPFTALFSQYTDLVSKIAGLQSLYDSLIQQDLQLIDGKAHTAKYPIGTGHPFFLTKEPVKGIIFMHGQEFRHSFIRYDVFNDILQIYHFAESGPQIIDLNRDKIDAFSIEGHYFINLLASDNPDLSIPEGFYEVKYKGPVSLLLRYEKVYLDYASGSRGGYQDHLIRYLSTQDCWFRISGRKSLLNAFGEDREEINKYLRKSGISVKLATDEDIIRIIKFSESIN